MKVLAVFGAALVSATVTGCVVAPVEPVPVVYSAPPPPAIVVRPAPRYHYHHYHGRYRYWR